jgi:hypothetical protein
MFDARPAKYSLPDDAIFDEFIRSLPNQISDQRSRHTSAGFSGLCLNGGDRDGVDDIFGLAAA